MPLSRLQFKQLFRQVYKVVAGGPTDVTRSSNVINMLDKMADDFALKSEIPQPTDAFVAIAENQYGTHPRLTTQAELNAFVLAAVANGTAVTVPPAPTGGQVDDVNNIFSHAAVAGFSSASEYELEKSDVEVGYSTPSTIYAQAGRIYYPGITGPHSVGSIHARVKASGSRPAGNIISNQVAFTGPAVSAPSQITSLSTSPGSSQVALSWQAPASNGAAITSYVVKYRAVGAASWLTFGTTANTSIAVTGLTNGTPYEFTAAATNSAGTGEPSAPVQATPAAPQAPAYPHQLTGPSEGDETGVTLTSGGSEVLRYTKIQGGDSTPKTGYVMVGSTQVASLDFGAAYLGQPLRFDIGSSIYTSTFQDGSITLQLFQ